MTQIRPDELIRLLLGELQALGAGVVLLGYDENGAFAGDQNVTGANSVGIGDTVAVASDYSVIGGGRTNAIVAGADHATISGGRDNTISNAAGDYSTIGGGYNNDIAGSHGVIGGGLNNTIAAGSDYSIIGSGEDNDIVSGDWNVIGGGDSNSIDAIQSFIGGGFDSSITGNNSVIGGGAFNDISDHDSVIAGGGFNTIAERYGAIGGGVRNEIAAPGLYCTIPGGLEAKAEIYGQLVHAGGEFANAGDAQGTVQFVVRHTHTHINALWQSLTLNGDAGAISIVIPTDSVRTFHCLVVGTTQGCTKSFGYEIRGVIENDAGATTMLASVTTTLYEDDVSFDAQAVAIIGSLIIQVRDTDAAGDTVRWVATIRTAEVTFPA